MNQTVSMLPASWLYLAVPLVFLVIAIWIYRPNAKRRYKADGSIPFEETEVKPNSGKAAVETP